MRFRGMCVAAVLTCCLLAATGGPPGASAEPAPAPVAAATAAAGDHHIDNWDRSQVRRAWQNRMKDNLDTPSGWLGVALDPVCQWGAPSAEAQAATRESVNFVRAMAGLDPIGFRQKLSDQAQKAAVMMDAQGALSHDPPSSWACWTEAGAKAAGRSNLILTSGTLTAGGVVETYMDDKGSTNKVAGHRRWILNPKSEKFGHGMTDQADALYVIGPLDAGNRNPRWVPWPTAGWFPTRLQPAGRWSLSSGDDDADFSHATVVVRHGGKRLDVRRYQPVNGYGKPTLVFQVKGIDGAGTYAVAVRHIRGAGAARHTWKVKLF